MILAEFIGRIRKAPVTRGVTGAVFSFDVILFGSVVIKVTLNKYDRSTLVSRA